MNPTRSANSTVTRRRSAIRAGPGAGAGRPALAVPSGEVGATAGVAPSEVPHSPQKRAVGGFAVPQLGQTAASRVPHSPQNFRPSSFGEPQLGQVIGGS